MISPAATCPEISAGGTLNIISTGNQTIEAAKFNAGGDLTLQSTQGSISFNAVKDLLQETHEKSNSNISSSFILFRDRNCTRRQLRKT